MGFTQLLREMLNDEYLESARGFPWALLQNHSYHLVYLPAAMFIAETAREVSLLFAAFSSSRIEESKE